MNRKQRRAMKGQTFVAKCNMCEAKVCPIHVQDHRAVDPTGPQDFGVCKGCPCAVGKCDVCGETGEHWLGCKLVGIEEMAPPDAVLQ